MRLLLVAGARPQFVKAAALLPALQARGHEVLFVHTGQHPDPRMVEAHFAGLDLPAPDARLPLRHAQRGPRLAEMIDGLSGILRRYRPARTLALGDADSALAAALASDLCGVPVAHVEAGARSRERALPEERNRIVVDALSDLLFCATAEHASNLAGREGVHLTGDVMADVLLARREAIRARAPDAAAPYTVFTLHRAGTADDPELVGRALGAVEGRVLFPRHPRTRLPERLPQRVELLDPLPYLEFLGLVSGARCVVTDSGGLQKEAYLLGVPCVTLRERTEWGETLTAGWNVLAGTDPVRIRRACARPPRGPEHPPLFGDGRAARRIAELV